VLDASASLDRKSIYQQRVRQFEAEIRDWQGRSDRLSNLRVVAGVFVAAMLVGGWWWRSAGPFWPWLLAACGGLGVFVALVARHRWVRRQQAHAAGMVTLNRHGLARLDRVWNRLPAVELPPGVVLTPTARDLDLFGSASLFRLCCVATTGGGRTCLARWLLTPADVGNVLSRQQCVAELAAQLDLRQELTWRGQSLHGSKELADAEPLVRWAEGPAWLARRSWLSWYARLSPLLLVVLSFLNLSGHAAGMWWQAVVCAQMAVSYLVVQRVHEIFRQIDSGEQQLHRFAEMLALVETWPVTTQALVTLQQQLSVGGHRAHEQLTRLRRRLDLADLRYSQLVYGILQATTLWDFHVLASLERWQRQVGPHLRDWLDALAQFEALCSLATLAYDHPAWTFPVVDPQGPRLVTARDLAHPLLPTTKRVGNDVELGPDGTFLLVTGSNMSGKSTLLRAIGVNLMLAQAGAPVCANRLSLPCVMVETSMRIDDSLADGVSLFLAELQRLKSIVERARQCDAPGAPVLIFLLDEILHGTNSRDRQIAVRRVVDRLLAHHALGAVSTHDLELAAAPPLSSACRAVHFREQFVGEGAERKMTFDYQLRPGIASTTNALELLNMVGLADEAPPAGDAATA
jgi:MutS domain V